MKKISKNDFTYQTNMDKISDLNSKYLDEIAEEIDGVSSGRELAEKYPDGWVATDAHYNTGFESKSFWLRRSCRKLGMAGQHRQL